MCRLLGLISAKPRSAERYLLQSECSLLRQAILGEQGDGWGIGFYYDDCLNVFKSEKPVYDEADLFEEVSKKTEGRIIIAHVRKASNPRGLDRDILISPDNSQPFHYKSYLFVHNGTVNIPDEIAKRLGNRANLIKGLNDSEVYFHLLINLIESNNEDVISAFQEVEAELWDVFHEDKVTKWDAPFTSLNTILSDGDKLYTFVRYMPNSRRSICYGDSPVFEMCYMQDETGLVVASERLDSGNWTHIGDNSLLTAWVEGGEVRHELKRL